MNDVLTAMLTSNDWRSVLLGVIAFAVGIVAALITSKMLQQRLRAEQELARRLHSFYAKRAELEHLRRIARKLENDGDHKDELMKQYEHLVNQLTDQLVEAEARLIIQALKQPSKRGRRLYLRKLAKEASQDKERFAH